MEVRFLNECITPQTEITMLNKKLEIIKNKAEQARSKRLVIFDIDGTLAPSKGKIDNEMSQLINHLLEQKIVAVICGGAYTQIESQFLSNLHAGEKCLMNLFLFPTSGSSFLQCKKGAWAQEYEYKLLPKEQERIIAAIEKSLQEISYIHPTRTWGNIIENRGTQITFSPLGQKAPIDRTSHFS